MYLIQSGSEKMREKRMAKNPNQYLSCLDYDDVLMQDIEPKDKIIEETKGLEKISGDIDIAAEPKHTGGQIVGSEPGVEPEDAGSIEVVNQEVAGSGEIEGCQPIDPSTPIM